MQQLETSKQIVEAEQRYKREGKGRVLAISRRIYRLQKTDVFYVESESSDNFYYFVKYQPSVLDWCSCRDNSTRGMKCKHICSIEFATRFGTLKDIDRLPTKAKVKKKKVVIITTPAATKPLTKLYIDDDYSF